MMDSPYEGQRGRCTARVTPSSTARTRTPERKDTSQQAHRHPLPPDYPLISSVSSYGRVGWLNRQRSRSRAVGNKSSATWTSSSDGGGGGGYDLANLSDTDVIQDRSGFVAEYNRLAGKYGIRPFTPLPRVLSAAQSPQPGPSQQKRTGWFSRTFLRQPSTASSRASSHASANGSVVITRPRPSESRRASHRRSVSDLAIHMMQPILKRDTLRGEDLQSLIRLCGKSFLYLPSEYAPGSLVLPTCLRATAQYLVQHAVDTRGVFRIPGSVKVVNALYDYYCAEGNADDITSTIRSPNLPHHIRATTHDVASTFKRLLSGLPGGILGSLPLFDAMVAIHSQLNGDPELTRTKQTKLRARMIAIAIGTVESQFRRELICAVFGLLCLIGRVAETAPREDEHGRPLPTADLIGYNALGIVFGPLLASDLLNSYTMRLAYPNDGLVLFPVTPPNTRREKRKTRIHSGEKPSQQGSLIVDKIHVANSITEMLITHWREVVKHLKSLDILKPCVTDQGDVAGTPGGPSSAALRPSTSESFVDRPPAEWTGHKPVRCSVSVSPVPPSPTPQARRRSDSRTRGRFWGLKENDVRDDSLIVKKQRIKSNPRATSSTRATTRVLSSVLSPTAEEALTSPQPGDKPVSSSNDQLPVSIGEPLEFQPLMSYKARLSQRDENVGLSRDAALQERERRLVRRRLKSSRSSRSSQSSKGQVSHADLGKDASSQGTGGTEKSGQTKKGSIFPNWKQRLYKAEKSSEAAKANVEPSNTQPVGQSKSKMVVTFHLKKSASDSGAGSQEHQGGPSTTVGRESESHNLREEVPNYPLQHLSVTVGYSRDSMGNASSVPIISPAEEPHSSRIPGGIHDESSRCDSRRPGNAEMSGNPDHRKFGPLITGEIGDRVITSKENSPMPSHIALQRGTHGSWPGHLQSCVQEKRGELPTGHLTGDHPLEVSGANEQPTTESKLTRDLDYKFKSDDGQALKAPTTPPRGANQNEVRVQSPPIPARLSSIDRNMMSPIRKTPFPGSRQPGPATPDMGSPSRRSQGRTGSSVKAMAAMFERGTTNIPSPLKQPAPAFHIPTPTVRQRSVRKQRDGSRRKLGTSSSLVSEYTVNAMTPFRALKKSQTTGDNLGKFFSFSPAHSLRSQRSWATAVPIPGDGPRSTTHSEGADGDIKTVEDDDDHSWQTVEGEHFVTHPSCKVSDVFWAGQEKKKGDSTGIDGPERANMSDKSDNGSVKITRHLTTASPESENSRPKDRPNNERRPSSIASTGKRSLERVASASGPQALLGNLASRCLPGTKFSGGTPPKGTPAKPEVVCSTAVASLIQEQRRIPWSNDRKKTTPQARVEVVAEEHSFEVQDTSPLGRAQPCRSGQDDFSLPATYVEFSDLDIETQQPQSQRGLLGAQYNAGYPVYKGDRSVEPLRLSAVAMDGPYSATEPIETPRGATQDQSALMRTEADERSTNKSISLLPPNNSPFQKTTKATRVKVSGSPSPRSLKTAASTPALHTQLRALQRQLDQRTEEVKKLRRRLGTKEKPRTNTEIVTLKDQLTKTRQECNTWRERAEAAERRVAMFERITTRVRDRRQGMRTSERKEGSHQGGSGPLFDKIVDIKEKQNAKETEAQRRQSSREMQTADEETVADKIRTAIHWKGRDIGAERGDRGRWLDGEYSFPADDEDAHDGHEGVWLDFDATKTDDEGYYDEGRRLPDNAGAYVHGFQAKESVRLESTTPVGSPLRPAPRLETHTPPGSPLRPTIRSHQSSRRHDQSSSTNLMEFSVNRLGKGSSRQESSGTSELSMAARKVDSNYSGVGQENSCT